MIAVDNGITGGHLTAADVFFLIGAIAGLLAALLAIPRRTPPVAAAAWATVLGWFAVACIAFAWFIL